VNYSFKSQGEVTYLLSKPQNVIKNHAVMSATISSQFTLATWHTKKDYLGHQKRKHFKTHSGLSKAPTSPLHTNRLERRLF